MLHNRPLRLQVANKSDCVIAVRILGLLVLFAAVLSPRPILMSIFVMALFGVGWGAYTLGFFKVNTEKLTVVLFLDGQIRLESDCKDPIGGVFVGQQWCTHRLAILRINVGDVTRNLLILSAQQQQVDDFRRLNMWLRQGFYKRTGKKQVPDI